MRKSEYTAAALLVIMVLYLSWGAFAAEGGGLIVNGEFEAWRNGAPVGWKAVGVTRNESRGGDGFCIRFPNGKKGALSQELPNLKPNTTYRLDYSVQKDVARGGGVRFTISGCDGKGLTNAGAGGYFAHLAPYRYTRYFTTGGKVDAAKIVFSGDRLTLDGVSISTLDGGFSGIEFSGPNEAGEIDFTVSFINQTPDAHAYKLSLGAVNYFEEPVAVREAEVKLAVDESVSFKLSFPAGYSKRYRMFLKAVRDDGYVFEEARFYEPETYATQTRRYVNLRNAGWKVQMQGKDRDRPEMQGKWKKVLLKPGEKKFYQFKLPPYFHNVSIPLEQEKDYWGFFKAEVTLPEYAETERVIVDFPFAYHNPRLTVNGKLVGEAVSALPLRADVTEALKNNGAQELLLRLGTGKSVWDQSGEGNDLRGKLLYAHQDGQSGLMRDPWLEIVPQIRVKRVFIDTSYRNKEVALTYVLRNDSRVSRVVVLEPEIFGRGKSALRIKPVPVLVYAEQEMRVKVKAKWDNPTLWQVRKPYLYHLTTKLLPGSKEYVGPVAGADALDVHHQRFGFKEIWTEDRALKFNGETLKLKSMLASPHPGYTNVPNTYENCWKQYMVAVRAGLFFFTNHVPLGSTPPDNEIADELGILMRPKLSINMAFSDWRQTFDDSPRFWKANADFARAMVARMYNHPSIGWITIENETFLCGMGDRFPQLFDRYREIVEAIKGIKPGLLVDFDGSDPGGIADLWNMHYPMKYQRWIPLQKEWNPPIFEDGQWLPFQLFPGAGLANNTKPLVFGEDIIEYPEMPGVFSFLSDEDVYESVWANRMWSGNPAAVIDAIDRLHYPFISSYRRAGATVVTSWPMIGKAFDDLDPERIFVEQMWRNVRSGESVEITARVHHDLLERLDGKLQWTYIDESGKEISSGSRALKLVPGDIYYVSVRLDNPDVKAVTAVSLKLALVSRERVLTTRETAFTVFPDTAFPKAKVLLYDPNGETAQAFESNRIKFKAAESPKKGALFVIGKNALVDNSEFAGAEIVRFVERGGRVLVLEQEGRIPEWLPLRLRPQVGVGSYAMFPRSVDHPVVKGIDKSRLQFWRGGGWQVSKSDYWKPGGSNLLSLLDTGNIGGYLTSALAEYFVGKGSILLCQARITENLGRDPAADRLLANILEYSRRKLYRTVDGGVEVVGESADVKDALSKIGITVVDKSDILFCDGGSADTEVIKKAMARVNKGATLWVQGLTPASVSIWDQAGLEGLRMKKYSAGRLYKTAASPLLSGLSNSDLYWKGMTLASMPGGYGRSKEIANICEFETELPGAEMLLEKGALLRYRFGAGVVFVDNVMWRQHLKDLPARARRIPAVLATNLGVTIKPRGVDRSYDGNGQMESIDIGSAANIPLNDNLSKQKNFGGIPFEIKGNALGAVMPGSKILTERLPQLSSVAEPITVDKNCSAIYFLVTAYDPYEGGLGYGSGELIGGVDIEYDDGTKQRQELRHKVHLLNLFESMGDLREGKLVWEGDTPFAVWLDKMTRWEGNRWIQREHPNRLYLVRWVNPAPEKTVESLRLFSTDKHILPILIAVTAEVE